MDKKIIEVIVPTAALAVVTFFFSLLMNYLFGFNSLISIGTTTMIDKDQYVVPVDIQSYNEVLKDIQIVIDTQITEDQVKSSQPLDVKIIKNNVGQLSTTTLEIAQITKEQFVNLLILTDRDLNKDEIKVYPNENKIDIVYDSMTGNPFEKQVKSAILYALIYAILFGLTTYFSNKKSDKRIADYKEDRERKIAVMQEKIDFSDGISKQLTNDLSDSKEQIEEIKNKVKKHERDSIKKQILLQAKLNDYSKELSFWRNTIRKILYNESSKYPNKEKIFEVVSESLKTYQTHETHKHDFETLKVLSRMINDIDNETN